MRIKLDENFGRRGVEVLRTAGHDASTVIEQGLNGASDQELLQTCTAEKRCLVSLDLDFSNPINFNPKDYAGIAVFRLPHPFSYPNLIRTPETFTRALAQEEIEGQLWIVELERIRKYQPRD